MPQNRRMHKPMINQGPDAMGLENTPVFATPFHRITMSGATGKRKAQAR